MYPHFGLSNDIVLLDHEFGRDPWSRFQKTFWVSPSPPHPATRTPSRKSSASSLTSSTSTKSTASSKSTSSSKSNKSTKKNSPNPVDYEQSLQVVSNLFSDMYSTTLHRMMLQ